MNPETENIIKEQMKILPKEVINILADPAWSEKVLTIGRKNGLTEEQSQTLLLETNLVLLGLVHPDEYADELKNRLKIDEMKADNIVSDINREILSGVREKLIAMFASQEQSFIEEGKKRALNADWQQNLDFVLSGGDYSVFLENARTQDSDNTQKADKLIGTSNILETKRKLVD
jgi:hypothetical protein